MMLSHGPDMTIGDRIKVAREAKGWTQQQLADAIGAGDASTIGQAELRETGAGKGNMVKIAAELGVSLEWLLTGVGNGPVAQPQGAPANPVPNFRGAPMPAKDISSWPADLPVYGTAAAGPDGAFELNNGEITEWIRRPPMLATVAKAYAVRCEGTSMVPVFEPGDLVCVHPKRPVSVGDYVLIVLHPNAEGENPAAFVKRLVRRGADRIEVDQINGARRMTFAWSKIDQLHYVIRPNDLLKG